MFYIDLLGQSRKLCAIEIMNTLKKIFLWDFRKIEKKVL
jgi:hypothetical protein